MKKLILLFILLIPIYAHSLEVSGVDGGGNADTLEGQNGSFYLDIGNQQGDLNSDNIDNWDTVVGEVNAATGVDTHEGGFESCEVSINVADPSKVDIIECNVHIQGPHYPFATITSLDPQFGAGENSVFIGVTMNGYTTQTPVWTNTQKMTIIPLARLNTELGDLGPGSDVHLIRDDRYFLTENFYFDRVYHEEAMGALYVTGGDVFANATSGLILGQNEGILWDGQKKRHTLQTFENRSSIFLHLSSNEVDWIGTKEPLVVDAFNYNPPGSSLTPMLNDNTFTIHTILKSPKGINGVQEGELFFVYGDTEYATAAAAVEAISSGEAVSRFGVLIDQATSGLVPAALIIQQRNAVAVDTIVDRRPCLVCRP